MSKRNSDPLFQLVKSLTKSEKRNFKLVVNKTKSAENSKFLQLFNFLDKQEDLVPLPEGKTKRRFLSRGRTKS